MNCNGSVIARQEVLMKLNICDNNNHKTQNVIEQLIWKYNDQDDHVCKWVQDTFMQ